MKHNFNSHLLDCLRPLLIGLLLGAAIVPHSSAHLMVAQHGTLNIVGNGVFMVLSLPISAFSNVDDDGNDQLSRAEFTKHHTKLVAAVNQNVRLLENGESRLLQGMMLSPVAPHDNPRGPANQLVVMGRYQLVNVDNPLSFHLGLFGKNPEEQQQKISLSYPAKSLKNKIILTPKLTDAELFTNSLLPNNKEDMINNPDNKVNP